MDPTPDAQWPELERYSVQAVNRLKSLFPDEPLQLGPLPRVPPGWRVER